MAEKAEPDMVTIFSELIRNLD